MDAVRFYSRYASCIVLARELTLKQIETITKSIQTEDLRGCSGQLLQIELFCHGALCVSISGKCYMSLALYNRSANRGECVQPCRRKYRVIDEETQNELMIDNHYIMSPKDLCTIGVLDQIISTGVNILKIEGRGRSPEYVHAVVSAYREAIDAIASKTYSQEKIDAWMNKIRCVYNRGFWEGGYYLGEKLGEWSGAGGSRALKRKIFAGTITHYFPKIQVAECLLQSSPLQVGDEILITGSTTGVVEGKIHSLHTDAKVDRAEIGVKAAFPISTRVRKNDKLYVYARNSQTN